MRGSGTDKHSSASGRWRFSSGRKEGARETGTPRLRWPLLVAALSVVVFFALSAGPAFASILPAGGVQLTNWTTTGNKPPAWITGTLQSGNSDYKEGETVPFRVEFSSTVAPASGN